MGRFSNIGKANIEIKSTTKRAGSLDAELVITTTPGKVKINEAAAKFLNIKSKEYMMFLADETDPKDIIWMVAKGYAEKDAKGNIMMTTDRLTKADKEAGKEAERVPKMKGCKMSTVNGSAGFGILEGSDANNWPHLGGNDKLNIIYHIPATLLDDGEEVENRFTLDLPDGETVTAYVIVHNKAEEKIIRVKKDNTDLDSVNPSDEAKPKKNKKK